VYGNVISAEKLKRRKRYRYNNSINNRAKSKQGSNARKCYPGNAYFFRYLATNSK